MTHKCLHALRYTVWCGQRSSATKSQIKIFHWTSNRLQQQSCRYRGAISQITTPEARGVSKYNHITSQAEHLNRITQNHHVSPHERAFTAISSKAPKSQITKSPTIHLHHIPNWLAVYYCFFMAAAAMQVQKESNNKIFTVPHLTCRVVILR